MPAIPPSSPIDEAIVFIRNQRVITDSDLAALYGVETKALNRAVKRNIDRFPPDFMFQHSDEEMEALRCQIGTSIATAAANGPGRGGRRYRPYVFTEQGVAMLSGVLNSKRAVLVNIEIMRAFVRLRRLLSLNAEMARKLDAMERKYDAQFKVVFDAIRELMAPEPPKRRPIGFVAE